jgi:hypothetical protein
VTVVNFTDAPGGIASDYVAAVDWGDSTPVSAGTIGVDSSGGFLVTGDHAYVSHGNCVITVAIADAGGSQATALSGVSVLGRG